MKSIHLFHSKFNLQALFLGLFITLALNVKSQVPDKASPFTAVKWEAEQPVVRWEGEWYHFHEINGIPVESIIAYCKKTYEKRWQKRFSEDFVEAFTGMGYELEREVELVLEKDGKRSTQTGIMNEDYRDMVRDFNNGEDQLNPSPQKRSPKKIEHLSNNTSPDKLAKQMAAWMDKVWDADPPEDAANLRFLFYKNGAIFSGKIDIEGDFVFRARSKYNHTQAFNPNKNGRWVYENLAPGTYNLSIEGQNEYSDWSWSKDKVRVDPSTRPIFKIYLD